MNNRTKVIDLRGMPPEIAALVMAAIADAMRAEIREITPTQAESMANGTYDDTPPPTGTDGVRCETFPDRNIFPSPN